MISPALGAALLLAATQANPTVQSRTAYSGCLNNFMSTSLEAKVDPAAFDQGVQAACSAQEASFRNASIAFDTKLGSSRAQAEEDANFQIEDYLVNVKEGYRVRYQALHGGKPDRVEAADIAE